MPIKPFNPVGLTAVDRFHAAIETAEQGDNPLAAVSPVMAENPGLLSGLVAATVTTSITGALAGDTLPYLLTRATVPDDRDPDFDVSKIVTDEWLAEHPFMADSLRSGVLDDVPNQERFDLFTWRQRRDSEMREALGGHGLFTQFAFTLPGQALDFALLRGLGVAPKLAAIGEAARGASLGRRVVAGAALGAAANLAQEGALFGLNPNRNVDEETAMMWSVGMGAAFGGGVAGIAGGTNKLGGMLSSRRLDRMGREVAEALKAPKSIDLRSQVADDAAELRRILDEPDPVTSATVADSSLPVLPLDKRIDLDAASVPAPVVIQKWGDGSWIKIDAGGRPQNPVTGEAITVQVFRGSGRDDPRAPYAEGADGPVLGDGLYYAAEREGAEIYGPNVEETSVTLRNPLVITNDAQLKKALGGSIPSVNEKMVQALRALREQLQSGPHDGVIVSVPKASHSDVDIADNSAKKLRNLFGHSQVFVGNKAKTKAVDKAVSGQVFDSRIDLDAAGSESVRQVMFLRTPETADLIDAVRAKHGHRIEIVEHPQQGDIEFVLELERLDASLKDTQPANLGTVGNAVVGVMSSGVPLHGLDIPGPVAARAPSSLARRAARLWFDFSRPTQETLDNPATVNNRTPAEALKWNFDAARDSALTDVDDALRGGLKGGGFVYRMASGETVQASNRFAGRRVFMRAVVDHLRQLDELKRGHRATAEAPEAVRKAAAAVRGYARRMGTEALGVNLLRELDPERIYVLRRWRSDLIRLNTADFNRRLLKAWGRNRDVDYETGAARVPDERPLMPEVLAGRPAGGSATGRGLTDDDVRILASEVGDVSTINEGQLAASAGPDFLRRYLQEVDLYHEGAAKATIETLTKIDNRHGVEHGMAGGKVFMSRRLDINETEFAEYLDSDLDSLLGFYHRQTAGKIASRTAIKRDIEYWEPIVRQMTGESLASNSYDPGLIIQAVGKDFQSWLDVTAANRPLQEQLELAMNRSIGEKGILVHKLAELEGRPVFPGDSAAGAGWKLWGERNSLRLPYMAYLGKMTVSALTDLASAVFYRHLSPRKLGAMVDAVNGFAKLPNRRHLEGLYVANSDLLHSLRAMELGDVGGMVDSRAFGAGRTGRALQVTDSAMEWAAKKFGDATLINRWNTGMKRWTASLVMGEIIEGAGKMARVGDLMKGGASEAAAVAKVFGNSVEDAQRLARLGFNAERSARLVAMLERHGVYRDGVAVADRHGGKIQAGHFVAPELHAWHADDPDLFEAFTGAVNAETMNLIIEPKVMSKPLASSMWIGRMFNQFQSFSFSWGNQLAPLAAQRPGYEVLQYAGLMVALGGVVDAIHNSLSGRRSFEDTAAAWRQKPAGMVYGAVNRSGLTGWLARPMGLLERTPLGPGRMLGNDQLSTMGARPDGMLGQIGPFMNWTDQVSKGATGVMNGDFSSATQRQLWSATPWHNLWQVEGFNRLAEQMGYDTPVGPSKK